MDVVVLSSIWPAAIEQLRGRHRVHVALCPPADQWPAVLREAQVAIVRSGVQLDASSLRFAPRLQLIIRAGMGLDGIDCQAARQQGIRVISVPLSAQSVAEHTIGLMLAVMHQIVRHDAALRAGRWEKHSGYGRDIFGRRLGLLGFGRIGQRTGQLAAALGMHVRACDRSPQKAEKQRVAAELGLLFVPLDDLLPWSEVLAIQTPLDDSTRGLLDRRRLAQLPAGAVVINVGRGGVIDESALFDELSTGRLAGAALDVFEREPPGQHPLLSLSTFVGTPHAAAQTEDAQARVGMSVVRIVDDFAAGGDWKVHGMVIV